MVISARVAGVSPYSEIRKSPTRPGTRAHTPTTQFSWPAQSPVAQARPGFAFGNVQLVLHHTRPCQSGETLCVLESPDARAKPCSAGPVPNCVFTAGHMASPQLFVMMRGTDPSLLWRGRLGTPRRKCSGFEAKAMAPGTKAERRRHEHDSSKVESPLKGRSL
jgi:hypothetical protein